MNDVVSANKSSENVIQQTKRNQMNEMNKSISTQNMPFNYLKIKYKKERKANLKNSNEYTNRITHTYVVVANEEPIR